MITISNSQQMAFAAPYDDAFVARVRSFVEAKLARLAGEVGNELEPRIRSSLAEACGLGIISEQEQVLYVVLALLNGPRFAEREPWARQALARHVDSGRQSGLAQSLMDANVAPGGAGT